MVVKKEDVVDLDALMQKIDALLQIQKTPPTPHLNEEAQAKLSAPLDPKFLKQRKGRGGETFTYADLDYLERRAGEVDPDWGAPAGLPMFTVTNNSVVCNITICSVPRSAAAGYYIPDTYDVWDNDKRQMVAKKMTKEMAHTIVTAAQAAAERRAFAMFGLGAELWAKNQEGVDEPIGPSTKPSGAARSTPNGEFRAPSEKRIDLLGEFGVPESIAKRINSWSRGKDSNGNPISDVSETINGLFQARGKGNRGPVERQVWERVVNEHAPYALQGLGADDEDDDF